MASWLTATLMDETAVVPVAVPVTAVLLDEVTVEVFQELSSVSLKAASDSDDTWDLMVPMVVSLDWMVVAWVSSFVSGTFSKATNCEMMLVTSRPLPMPVEEIAIEPPCELCTR